MDQIAPVPTALPLPDPAALAADLDAQGYAILPGLLAPAACRAIRGLYDADAGFRSRVVMQRHGFGRGEYKYFGYPLPAPVDALRQALYPLLAPVARRWAGVLGWPADYPPDLGGYLARCHAAGQIRPTPLLLKYGPGDYNCLHQDLYGDLVFPLQATVLLSRPGEEFTGGEFLLVEQRPRAQSRGEVVALGQGDAVVFAVHQRPVQGTRGPYRVTHRHGVSQLRSGQRFSLGVILHDAA